MTSSSKYEFLSAQHKLIGYPYLVWLFSLLFAPLLYSGWLVMKSDDGISGPEFLIVFPIFFLFFSLAAPAFIIYLLAFWKIADSKLLNIQKKLLLTAVGVGSLLIETALFSLLDFYLFKTFFSFFRLN